MRRSAVDERRPRSAFDRPSKKPTRDSSSSDSESDPTPASVAEASDRRRERVPARRWRRERSPRLREREWVDSASVVRTSLAASVETAEASLPRLERDFTLRERRLRLRLKRLLDLRLRASSSSSSSPLSWLLRRYSCERRSSSPRLRARMRNPLTLVGTERAAGPLHRAPSGSS